VGNYAPCARVLLFHQIPQWLMETGEVPAGAAPTSPRSTAHHAFYLPACRSSRSTQPSIPLGSTNK